MFVFQWLSFFKCHANKRKQNVVGRLNISENLSFVDLRKVFRFLIKIQICLNHSQRCSPSTTFSLVVEYLWRSYQYLALVKQLANFFTSRLVNKISLYGKSLWALPKYLQRRNRFFWLYSIWVDDAVKTSYGFCYFASKIHTPLAYLNHCKKRYERIDWRVRSD